MKLDIIIHWKLFDIEELPNDAIEWRCLFIKGYHSRDKMCYYFDNIGIGIDYFGNTKYTLVAIRLIAFTLQFQTKKPQRLKLL